MVAKRQNPTNTGRSTLLRAARQRAFVTSLAKKIVAPSGSLQDAQQLAGHASLSTTRRYIGGSSDAKRKAIEML